MKYKVGDRVRIKEDLNVDEDYGSINLVSDMLSYKGKYARITKILDNRRNVL